MTAGEFQSDGTMAETNMSSVPLQQATQGVAGAPNEASLLALMEKTGYSMIQENGQRKYGGPPPGWAENRPAPRGCEIFVGKIPRDCYEDELVPLFEKIGRIYELRLMMDFSGTNRGYCFVMYQNRSDAKRAVRELNNYELRKGRFIGVCLSVDNCRLFVGGIPKNKTKEEIFEEMEKVTEGVKDVIVYPSATDKSKNRGFAFVEYESHRAAAMARRKLIPGRIQLWGHPIAVDWAEPEQDVDEDVMSKVKILYVRNLMLSTSEENLEKVFNQACNKDNAIERVKKIRDYAFVHYREREDALNAMHMMNGSTVEGSLIEVVLAKPVDKTEYVRYTRQTGTGPAALPQMATAMPYALAGVDPALYGAYYNQLAAAAAVSAANMATVSDGLPTRPGAIPGAAIRPGMVASRPMRGRGRGAAGSRAAGGIGRGHQMAGYLRTTPGYTYKKPGTEGHLYDILPGMELKPTNPFTLKPNSHKTQPQILEELCYKNRWGTPIYNLVSAESTDHITGKPIQVFGYKVKIPGLASHGLQSVFQPQKLCDDPEMAQNVAADYVLLQLQGYPGTTPGVPTTAANLGMMQSAGLAAAQQHYAAGIPQMATAQQLSQQYAQMTAPVAAAATAQPQNSSALSFNSMNNIAAATAGSMMMSTSPADNAAATAALYQGRPLAPSTAATYSMNGTTSSPIDTHTAMFNPNDFASFPMISSANSPYMTMAMAPNTGGKLASPPAGLQSANLGAFGFPTAAINYTHYA